MHTNRGSSLALYVVGGWNAPIGVKITCGKETDAAVLRKFEQPLAFDEDVKNRLKGFWYYSFYRGCLFSHGYDFSGNPIPASRINTERNESHYENSYGGFSFTIPGTVTLTEDNTLDVEYDDQLLHTTLDTTYGAITIDTFLKHSTFTSAEDIATRYAEEPFSNATTTTIETRTSPSGVLVTIIHEKDGATRLAFMSSKGYVVDVYATALANELVDTIITSLI
jgi:hypothetical protein